MAEIQDFYNVSDYGDDLKPADTIKIEHRIYASRETDISHLTALPLERLQAMREASMAAEQKLFDGLRDAAKAWEPLAAQTILYDHAIEYVKTPAVQHTANQWEKTDYDWHNISNTVYKMSYHTYEDTKYDRATQQSVPVAWYISWDVRLNTPDGRRGDRIVGQDKKRFTDQGDMEKYLAGRIKAYADWFTEVNPPVPQMYVKLFTVNGQLLPGYTVAGQEPKQPDLAAATVENAEPQPPDHSEQPDPAADATVGGDSISEKNTGAGKERTGMNEPLDIRLSTPENATGEWLKLPATTEQLQAVLDSIGAKGNNFTISGIDSSVPAVARLPLENVQKAGLDEMNHLAAGLEKLAPVQLDKLEAASVIMSGMDDPHRLTEYTQNTDFFVHIPDVFNETQLGEYYINKSGMIDMPEDWKSAVDVEKLGELANVTDKGIFTEHGYILPTGDQWKPVTEIPQEYQITPKDETPGRDYDAVTHTEPVAATPPEQRHPTAQTKPPEQTAKPAAVIPLVLTSDNPRDKLKEITGKLEQGIKDIFDSDRYKDYLKTLSKFHNYSMNNCILIAMQKPDASQVAGFNAWRDTFKRPVMKGEKGIKILAPAPFKTTKQVDARDGNGQPIIGKDGKPVKEEKEITVPAFKVTTVFDVSQTDGEPLPQIGVNELAGSVDRYKEFFAALKKTAPVPIGFEAIHTGAKGYYDQMEKRIAINEGMSELQNLKTAIHEIAHSRLHAIDTEIPLKGQTIPDRRTREIEAESIAYTVCQHYGLDTSDYSFGYVAGWSGDKQLDALKSSLDTIRKEADAIITEVDKHLALTQDKTQAVEQATPEQTAKQSAMQGLGREVETTLQWFVDCDIKDKGAVQAGTLEMIAKQGYEYRDGRLQQAAPEPGDTFTIYQLKSGDETRDLRFEPFARLEAAGLAVALVNYEKVYAAPLEPGATLGGIYQTFNIDRPEDFKGHSLSVSDVVVMNRDGKESAFYVDSSGFKELAGFLPGKEPVHEAAAPTIAGAAAQTINLVAVAGYMQKLNDGLQAVKPDSSMCVGAYNATIKRLEQSNERIPGEYPQLKALIVNAAQSPDFNTLKERMNAVQTEFTQHYSTAVQNTVDMSGKAQPAAPAVSAQQREHSPAPKVPAQGENVAVIEAKVKAGETINLSDLAGAIKADKQAARHTMDKSAATHAAPEKSSIRGELAAAKKQLAGQKSAPARAAAKNKNAGLEA